MTGPEILALTGILLVVSLIGPTMTLFRRPGAGQTAPAATTRLYRYRDRDGQMHELGYDELPAALGRWGYQTQSNPSFYFAFDLERVGGVVRIYIAEAPGYAGRAEDAHTTHRIPDGARHFICVNPESPPVNGREAATYIVYWAELTARYILTGEHFR